MEYQLKSTENIQAIQYVNDLDDNNENIPLKAAVDTLGLKEAWKEKNSPFGHATIFDGENKLNVPYGHYIAKMGEAYAVLSPETMALFQPVA